MTDAIPNPQEQSGSSPAPDSLTLDQIHVHHKLKSFFPVHSAEECAMLKESILEEGRLREKLLLWQSSEGKYYLLDGHRRFNILCKHREKGIKWEYEVVGQFQSIGEVKWQMMRLQLQRRNLTPFMLAYTRGSMYEELKKEPYRPKDQRQAHGKTKDLLAQAFKVSASTINRNAAFYKGVNRFADFYWDGECMKEKILRQESIFNQSDLEVIGKLNAIAPELLYRYKQLIGNFETLLEVPAEEREDFIKAFCERYEYLTDEEQTEIFQEKAEGSNQRRLDMERSGYYHKEEIDQLFARAAAPPLVRHFEKWVERQSRQIAKVIESQDRLKLDTKRQELNVCLEQITGLVRMVQSC
jgi:hypothetical protein